MTKRDLVSLLRLDAGTTLAELNSLKFRVNYLNQSGMRVRIRNIPCAAVAAFLEYNWAEVVARYEVMLRHSLELHVDKSLGELHLFRRTKREQITRPVEPRLLLRLNCQQLLRLAPYPGNGSECVDHRLAAALHCAV